MGKQCNILERIVSRDTKLAATLAPNLFSIIFHDEAKIWVFPAIKNVLIMENILKYTVATLIYVLAFYSKLSCPGYREVTSNKVGRVFRPDRAS